MNNTVGRSTEIRTAKRVVVIDDHAAVREGLRSLFESIKSQFKLVSDHADFMDALPAIARSKPDLILADFRVPGLEFKDFAKAVIEVAPETRLIVYSASMRRSDIVNALASGANGFVAKGASLNEVKNALRAVARDQLYVSPEIEGQLMRRQELALEEVDPY